MPKKKKKRKYRSPENELRDKLTKALRKVWEATVKRDFVKSVRMPNRGPEGYHFWVRCYECGCKDGITKRRYTINADKTKSKRESLWYQVDHINGLTPLLTLDDLSAHVKDLMQGPMQILCIECHKQKTKQQRIEAKRLKDETK